MDAGIPQAEARRKRVYPRRVHSQPLSPVHQSLRTLLEGITERPVPQSARPNTGFVRQSPRSGFKTALGTGAVFSHWGPRLTGVPVLL